MYSYGRTTNSINSRKSLFNNWLTMNKKDIIIFDLDWTLCELKPPEFANSHTWEEVVIESMKRLYELYWRIIIKRVILTWRKRKEFWVITEKWLDDNWIFYHELIMQEGSIWEKNHLFKEKELTRLREEYNIVWVFDDNPHLIPICSRLGIPLFIPFV